MDQKIKEDAEKKLEIINKMLELVEEYNKVDLGIHEPTRNIKGILEATKKELESTIASHTELTL